MTGNDPRDVIESQPQRVTYGVILLQLSAHAFSRYSVKVVYLCETDPKAPRVSARVLIETRESGKMSWTQNDRSQKSEREGALSYNHTSTRDTNQ